MFDGHLWDTRWSNQCKRRRDAEDTLASRTCIQERAPSLLNQSEMNSTSATEGMSALPRTSLRRYVSAYLELESLLSQHGAASLCIQTSELKYFIVECRLSVKSWPSFQRGLYFCLALSSQCYCECRPYAFFWRSLIAIQDHCNFHCFQRPE
jgi:hypothetical protein